MQIYKGISALSDFRKSRLLADLKKVSSSINSLEAEYVHFVDTTRAAEIGEDARLQRLLTYDQPFTGSSSGELILVVPRLGTISPWSSKATDIAINSGLTDVRRIERGKAFYIGLNKKLNTEKILPLLHDRMTESVLTSFDDAAQLFNQISPRPVVEVDIKKQGIKALEQANSNFGLALSEEEISYLHDEYKKLKRNPTDAELMMFAQINSEHCRHKVFNANWTINGEKQPKSLFGMIRNTYEKSNDGILSAYSDNAAVLSGPKTPRFFADKSDRTYSYRTEPIHSVIKVETHNHPTAIAPFPGAATGSGGEIRDEGATGRGAKPKMGLAGFSVSNLQIPGYAQPWEKDFGKPGRISSALDIMINAPIGSAAFNNEFGRPNLAGYFRTFEMAIPTRHTSSVFGAKTGAEASSGASRTAGTVREQRSNQAGLSPKSLGKDQALPELSETATEVVYGYHKPIMIAGGLGNIRDQHVKKQDLPVGALLIILGGPAMLIGLGGGAASSMQSGQSGEDLDFASVQRANPEMQRRVQEVIDQCWAMGANNPIISIHDIGAGGLSNGLPELVHDSGLGAEIELRDIPNAELGMSPREIWCNEAQERYVLGISPDDLQMFTKLCERENCLFAVVGKTTKTQHLKVTDSLLNNDVVDLPMNVLFGNPPKMERSFDQQQVLSEAPNPSGIKLDEAVRRVLHLPSVGSKQFLITIGDRNVGGLLTRDQMIGPWQVPVSDVAVAASGFESETGEAMAMGERTPLAVLNPPASARMAVGEAITNIAAANVSKLSDVKLSANWMAAVGEPSEDQALYDAVYALGEVFCPSLGITIPVGKDSLSMRTAWEEDGKQRSVTAPMSVIISAFSPVQDISKTLTPELKTGDTSLILLDLGLGKNRLGGSSLLQAYNQTGSETPDTDPETLKQFFALVQKLNTAGKILAYHDRSDGGLFATLCEMAFAGHCGLEIELNKESDALAQLFSEELGAVLQIKNADGEKIINEFNQAIPGIASFVGKPSTNDTVVFRQAGKVVYSSPRAELQSWWSETSYRIQALRDNPACAEQEFQAIKKPNKGHSAKVSFAYPAKPHKPSPSNLRPKVAIFRVQGVNGQVEMAAAFDRAGFTAVDVTLNDLRSGEAKLKDFAGLVACGGFSYGDVLGAGEGWAKSILFTPELREQFKQFFERSDTFSLGVCNGCQMLSALKELIPGAQSWPRFLRNTSEQFEARLSSVKLTKSPSIFFKDMEGSVLPVPVAHGEGRAENVVDSSLIAGVFVDNDGKTTMDYPMNPNGSPEGITALTTPDGRATIMMPHPERAFLSQQLSWHPEDWGKESPWFQMFLNAREWIG